MKRLIQGLLLAILLIWTAILLVFHVGTLTPPTVNEADDGWGEFISRESAGINHLIVGGGPYGRGVWSGRLTKNLLLQQEHTLMKFLTDWIPSEWILRIGTIGLILYFYDLDRHINKDDLLEMYGTSLSAPHVYDFLVDPYTRQLALHGIHEVGQLLVDQGFQDMGCTVAAVRDGQRWILGRNFDFEAGRIFDREKILKWVFPAEGHAFVSVIWAGMVGAVTGINEKGLYISINAAGSKDYRRSGTPSTLVVTRVLKEASTVDEAVKIFEESQLFISDIFVIADQSGNLIRLERSPYRQSVIQAESPFVVTNHLLGDVFAQDENDAYRRRELTTMARFERAHTLALKVSPDSSTSEKVLSMLNLLRDKGLDSSGQPLTLGHRRAIDALIATHSVVFDGARGRLYVSQGPAVSGPFLGYDLKASFERRRPVEVDRLPPDPTVSPEVFDGFKLAMQDVLIANRLRRKGLCLEAKERISRIPQTFQNQDLVLSSLGDIELCLNHRESAISAWQKALSLEPPYLRWRNDLERKLREEKL